MELDTGAIATNCLKFTTLAVLVLTYVFWGEWLLIGLAFAGAVPTCFAIAYMLGFLCTATGISLVDRSAEEEPEDAEDQFLIDQDNFIRSEETVGFYMGVPIPAFIIISPPGQEPVKLFWDSVCDVECEEPLSDDRWYVQIEPGLLYIEAQPGTRA